MNLSKGTLVQCFRKKRNLKVLIHGDDLVTLGVPEQLNWFCECIGKTWWTKERGVLGPDPASRICTSIRILHRIASVTGEGHEFEADSCHVELLNRGLTCRPDIAFAAEALARSMQKPRQSDVTRL